MYQIYLKHQSEKIQANNGITILNVTIPDYPLSASCFFVEAGSINDLIDKCGIAHLVEHIMFNKTTNYSSRLNLLKKIESKGMLFNAYTGLQNQQYLIVHNSKYSEEALEILVEGYSKSLFDKENLEKEKKSVLQESNDNYHDNFSYIWRLANKGLFGEKKLGKDFYGNIDTLRAIQVSDIESFYKSHFIADNTVFVFINSQLQPISQISQISQISTGNEFHSEEKQQDIYTKVKEPIIFEKRDIGDQVQLSFSILGPDINNLYDRAVQDLVNSYLSSGWISSFIQKLRVEKNYVYWVYPETVYLKNTGYQRFTLSTQKKYLTEVINIIMDELFKLNSITDIDSHKIKYLSDLERNMVDYNWLMNWYGYLSLPKTQNIKISTYIELIQKLDSNDFQKFFTKYVNNSKISLAYLYKEEIKNLDILMKLPKHM